MNPNVGNESSENPIKDGFRELIEGIRDLEEFSGSITELSDELRDIVDKLEKQGVDFSEINTDKPLLHILIDEYNTNFATGDRYHEKIAYPVDTTKKVVLDAITLSPEAQEVQKKFDTWCDNNQNYTAKHNIKENVKIRNDGIHLGGQILKWSGHTIGGVNVKTDEDLKKQPYTIQEMGAMMQALGGDSLKFNSGYKLGGNEISSFLSEVANVELGRFYWSSSRLEDYDYSTWGVSVNQGGVFVLWYHRDDDLSSLSSENLNSTL